MRQKGVEKKHYIYDGKIKYNERLAQNSRERSDEERTYLRTFLFGPDLIARPDLRDETLIQIQS